MKKPVHAHCFFGLSARVFAVLLMYSSFAQPLSAVAQESDAVRSYVVPEGEIRGMVLDSHTDAAIAGASITLMEGNQSTRTDAAGRFVLRNVARGKYQLVAQRRSYALGTVVVEMVPVVGWAVLFRLRQETEVAPVCGTIVCGATACKSVAVTVRDALTGGVPIAPIALRVSDRTETQWDLAQPERGDTVVTLHAGRGTGPFFVEVAAAGYAPWQARDIVVSLDRCGIPRQMPRDAWLLRVDPVGDQPYALQEPRPPVRE